MRRKRTHNIECDCLDETCGSLRFVQNNNGLIQIDFYLSAHRLRKQTFGERIRRAFNVAMSIIFGTEEAWYGIVINNNNKIQRLKDFVANMEYIDE